MKSVTKQAPVAAPKAEKNKMAKKTDVTTKKAAVPQFKPVAKKEIAPKGVSRTYKFIAAKPIPTAITLKPTQKTSSVTSRLITYTTTLIKFVSNIAVGNREAHG